jgi:transcriptional regulator with XRE-family HTH domain
VYSAWLKERMAHLGMPNLDALATASGINKGTLSKYFRGVQVPSIAAVPALCESLQVSPLELLQGLGVIPMAAAPEMTTLPATIL